MLLHVTFRLSHGIIGVDSDDSTVFFINFEIRILLEAVLTVALQVQILSLVFLLQHAAGEAPLAAVGARRAESLDSALDSGHGLFFALLVFVLLRLLFLVEVLQ